MKPTLLKSMLPHIIAVGIFLLVTIIFCKPALNPDLVLKQGDSIGWQGMAQQSLEYKKIHGHLPLWTNSMFGGMPAYQIAMEGDPYIGKGVTIIADILSLGMPIPMSFFFLACLCFYIMCICARIKPWAAIIGALAYAFATYNPIIIIAGHNTKMMSIAYAPMIIAGLLLLFDKKYPIGFLILCFFSTLLIGQNHFQIVYYTLILAALMIIFFTVNAIKEKQISHLIKTLSLGIFAAIIGVGSTAINILPTYDYAKETMRGGASKLTLTDNKIKNKTANGLDKDYAFRWSLGKMETFTTLVPGLFGGSNGGNEHQLKKLTGGTPSMVEKMSELGIPEESALGALNGYSYWGSMSSLSETTSGPGYLGAIICFLFIFGLIFLKGWQKWWLLTATLFGISLAWGNNFMAYNSFMIDHFPLLNKFRAPSMAMVIPQLCIPFMATLAVNKLFFEENNWNEVLPKIKNSAIVIGSIFILLGGFYFMSDYVGKGDQDIKENFTQSFSQGQNTPQAIEQAKELSSTMISALRQDRKSEAGSDILRSLIFVAIGFSIIYLVARKKIPVMIGLYVLLFFSTMDLLMLDQRYFNETKFSPRDEPIDNFVASPADELILKDPNHDNFRVFNTTSNYTNESATSYFHNSIGGYHPAKLGLYQDLIEHQITKGNMQVLNMLNTQYFITKGNNGQTIAQLNSSSFGNCWLVKGIKYVNGPNEEMLALDNTNLKDTVVVDQSYKTQIKQTPLFDSTGFIKVIKKDNDTIIYDYAANSPQFAVFSEIYYNRGWNAYVDGEKVAYAKVNYVLRGLYLPSGKHKINFIFEPQSYYLGKSISFWSTILLYLIMLFTLVYYTKLLPIKKAPNSI